MPGRLVSARSPFVWWVRAIGVVVSWLEQHPVLVVLMVGVIAGVTLCWLGIND